MKNGMHENKIGTKRWYKDGKRHREDGPAIIRANGNKSWYLYDTLHREDGPALIRANGTKQWWVNDKRYDSFDEWLKELDISDDDKLILTLKWA